MIDSPGHGPCPDHKVLAAFVHGQLSRAEQEAIGAHVAECPACAAALREREEANEAWARRFLGGPTTADPSGADRNLKNPMGWPVRGRDGSVERAPPVRVGQYEPLERIGRGGMGEVFRARHARLKKCVALKLLPPHRLTDPRTVARFEREMEVVGRLDHPNVVRATDAGAADGFHYLVMELIDGTDLARLLRRCGPLSVPVACELVRQAALGLQHAHENGLVHRDVKPGNIMLSARGEVKVLDLGLALLRDDLTADTLSFSGQVLGTADYMAPEQWDSSHDVDTRADVYGLGCTLFALLTGAPPFAGRPADTMYQKLRAHQELPVPPLAERCAFVPTGLEELVRRMLEKDPARRPQDLAAVARALAPFCQGADLRQLCARLGEPHGSGESGPVPTGERSTKDYPPTLRAAPSRRVRLAVVGIACVALAGAGVWLAWTRYGDSGRPRTPFSDVKSEPPLGLAPRTFKAGEWCELLDRPPREVFWAVQGANARAHFDPVRKTLTVVAPDAAMLEFDELGAPGFDLEATFTQTPWTGGVGLYYRGRYEPAQEQNRLVADVVSLERLGEPLIATVPLIYGEIRQFMIAPQRYAHSAIPPAGEVPRPSGDSHRLRLVVGQTGLKAVEWDDQPVPPLVKAAESSTRTGARGTVGIWCHNSTTQFSSVCVRPHPLPGGIK